MSKRSRILAGLAALAVVLSFCAGRYVVAATAGVPGAESDPLVTRSYVDRYTLWQVANLKAGQKLVAQAGTEIIVRAGKVKVIASAGGGLADVTAGRDLGQDVLLVANHLLIVPKSDGRGVLAVSDCVLMVKGAYAVQ
jgi:hypothetical protein